MKATKASKIAQKNEFAFLKKFEKEEAKRYKRTIRYINAEIRNQAKKGFCTVMHVESHTLDSINKLKEYYEKRGYSFTYPAEGAALCKHTALPIPMWVSWEILSDIK